MVIMHVYARARACIFHFLINYETVEGFSWPLVWTSWYWTLLHICSF